jgi:tripartite-type tricarboxylate transporter receptor subunit TctC
MRLHVAKLIAGIVSTMLLSSMAGAESYPARQIVLVVPYAPGGALDTLARVVGKGLEKQLGQPVIIENKAGGANIIGNAYVAHAANDGYTLLFAGAPLALNQALGMKQPYDALRDFEPVSLVATIPMLIAVNNSSPYYSLAEIIQSAKEDGKGLDYATAGVGSIPNLLGEALRLETKAKLAHIGYKGSAPAMTAVLGGSVPMIIDAFTPTGTAVKEGQLRGIVVASRNRVAALPDIPTTAEAGFPKIVGEGFYGILAPTGTSPEIVKRLHDATVKGTSDELLRKNLANLGFDIVASSPEEYAAYLRNEIERWTPLVKDAGIRVDQ